MSRYMCGANRITYRENGRFCSKFKLEISPRDILERDNLAQDLEWYVRGKVDVNGTFTYCRCRGQLCNLPNKSALKCFSTPYIGEEIQPLQSSDDLKEQNFFAEKNLVSCPPDIKQCKRYGM